LCQALVRIEAKRQTGRRDTERETQDNAERQKPHSNIQYKCTAGLTRPAPNGVCWESPKKRTPKTAISEFTLFLWQVQVPYQ